MDQVRRLEPLLLWTSATLVVALLVASSLAWSPTRRGAPWGRTLWASAVDVLVVSSLVVVVIVIVGPAETPAGRRLDLIPFRELQAHGFDRESALIELLGNVILFMPVAFFTALRFPAFRSLPTIVALGMGLSLALEGLQFALGTGREASVTDVLVNALGSALGYGAFCATRRMRPKIGVTSPDADPPLSDRPGA